MWIRKWIAIAMLGIGLTACTGMNSTTASLYEMDGRQWLVITKHAFDSGEGLFSTSQSTRIAVRRGDGTFQVIGTSSFSEDTEGSEQSDTMNPKFQPTLVGTSSSPTSDFRDDLNNRGTYVSDVDDTQITGNDKGILIVPETAFYKPKEEREREGGMY